MRTLFTLCFLVLIHFSTLGQRKLDNAISSLNSGSVPYVDIFEVFEKDSIVFLDTRTINEYEVSHLKDALWVGYSSFDGQKLQESIPSKNTPIVVYCSIGVRSEDIGEKLLNLGYLNVKNLYGGIFKWKNSGYPVVDSEGKVTEKVHAFDKLWGKLLTKGQKVYD